LNDRPVKLRFIFFISLCAFVLNLSAQDSGRILKVHFYYGSKPKFKYRKTEKKEFGGLHGGHVSIEVDDTVFGFEFKGKAHIFAQRKNCTGIYVADPVAKWVKDTVAKKYLTIIIPVPDSVYQSFRDITRRYLNTPPYDYAFLGMRCASNTQEIFAQLGFWKRHSYSRTVFNPFYPKILRKKMIRMAVKNNWKMIRHPGNPHRKWEKN
jgi:hypothetical protein